MDKTINLANHVAATENDEEWIKPVSGEFQITRFSTYQQFADSTAVYPGADSNSVADLITSLNYLVLKLNGEAGEVAEKLAKFQRGDWAEFSTPEKLWDFLASLLGPELGDVLWYISQIARKLELPMEKIASGNLEKLFDRKSRGVLKGSGDNR